MILKLVSCNYLALNVDWLVVARCWSCPCKTLEVPVRKSSTYEVAQFGLPSKYQPLERVQDNTPYFREAIADIIDVYPRGIVRLSSLERI